MCARSFCYRMKRGGQAATKGPPSRSWHSYLATENQNCRPDTPTSNKSSMLLPRLHVVRPKETGKQRRSVSDSDSSCTDVTCSSMRQPRYYTQQHEVNTFERDVLAW